MILNPFLIVPSAGIIEIHHFIFYINNFLTPKDFSTLEATSHGYPGMTVPRLGT